MELLAYATVVCTIFIVCEAGSIKSELPNQPKGGFIDRGKGGGPRSKPRGPNLEHIEKLSEEEKNELDKTDFQKSDIDGNGKITEEEIIETMKNNFIEMKTQELSSKGITDQSEIEETLEKELQSQHLPRMRESAKKVMKTDDEDASDDITFEEFRNARTRHLENWKERNQKREDL